MSRPRDLVIQTPGEPVVAPQSAADGAPAAPEQPVAPASKSKGKAKAKTKATLPSGKPRKELDVPEVVRNASEEAPASAARSVQQLPDQNEIDPASITYGQRVMTKQGWLCSTQDPPQQVRR